MKLNEATLLESFQESDLEIMKATWREVLSLIERNPFSDRMFFLLTHQEIATEEVENKMKRLSAPNCIGTAFFVAGVDSLERPYHAYDFELNPHLKQPGSEDWDDDFRMHDERQIPGAFVFSYSAESDGWHAGIYLGKIGDNHIMFAQHGHGARFGPELVYGSCSAPKYYIPLTLSKTVTPTAKI